jgi:tRNA-2-methylthio-N6-dimethylallyladenosine synthase
MLQTLLGEQQAAFNRATLGRVLPVLFEREGRRSGQLTGRSPYMQAVHATAPQRLLGRIVDLRIDGCHPNSLAGTVVTEALVGVAPVADPAKPARVPA